jgi:hypothetical protein
MGLPSLVITLAENQRPIASELHRRGYIEWLGHKDEVSLHQLEGHLGKLMAQPVPAHWSERCLELVDGMGAIRVAALMQLAQTARPVGRRAQLDDEATILRYAPAASALTCDQRHLASRVEVADSQRFRSDLRNIQQLQQYVMLAAPGLAAGVVTFRKMATESWKAMVTVGPEAAQSANMHAAFWCGAILAMRDCNQGSLQWESAAEGESTGLRIGLCSDARSWINRSVAELAVDLLRQGHSVAWAHSAGELPPGDICFYLSYGRIVDGATRARYRHNLVVHESDLPLGRGWAPMSWQILSGAREVTVTLLAAADAVDAGDIYLQERIVLEGHELHPEWRSMQAASTLKLCKEFVRSFPGILAEARPQVGRPTFYARRRPEDSRLDPKRSIREQFNLLRIVSNEQYPAYFHLDGQKYILRIEKADPS